MQPTEYRIESILQEGVSVLDAQLYADTHINLLSDLLMKMDMATSAASLEARSPLLDHTVAEFTWRLPLSLKVRNRRGKWLLREVLYKYVPRQLVDRPKTGFGVPIVSWLRGPLRDWAEDLLREKRLREDGIFKPGPILKKWREHLSGQRNWHYHLWDILMFQAWLAHQNR